MFGAIEQAELARPAALIRYWLVGRTLFADYGGPLLAVTVLDPAVVLFGSRQRGYSRSDDLGR